MEIMLLRQKIIDEEMRVAQQERLADEEKVKERRLKDKDRVGLTRCNFCVKYKKYYGKNYPNCCLLDVHVPLCTRHRNEFMELLYDSMQL